MLARLQQYRALDRREDVAINCILLLSGVRTAYIADNVMDVKRMKHAVVTVFPELFCYEDDGSVIYANRELAPEEYTDCNKLGGILGYPYPNDINIAEYRAMSIHFYVSTPEYRMELFNYISRDILGTAELAEQIDPICEELGFKFSLNIRSLLPEAKLLDMAYEKDLPPYIKAALLKVFIECSHLLVVKLHRAHRIDLFSPQYKDLYDYMILCARTYCFDDFIPGGEVSLIDYALTNSMKYLADLTIEPELIATCRAYYAA